MGCDRHREPRLFPCRIEIDGTARMRASPPPRMQARHTGVTIKCLALQVTEKKSLRQPNL